MTGCVYDIAIIGGGVNGCGIARDASGRGLSVFLAEKNDLASGTSSKSTKLIHGGLRYLEHYEFRLVRESLREREVLWSMAPHVIWPIRFVLPHNKDLRPAWLIRLGLFLYDHIGGRKILPACRTLDLTQNSAGQPLNSEFTRGFEYSDCWVDDARLVVLTARDAAQRGAVVQTRTEVTSVVVKDNLWRLNVVDKMSGASQTIDAKTLVNATGPWISKLISDQSDILSKQKIRLVQGSHVVVPKIFTHDRAYIFQNADGRIIFAIPYETDFTLIGTTDLDFEGDPGQASIAQTEIDYLCAAASEYFSKPIVPQDVVWSYSGVRPLFDEGNGAAQKASRDYVLDLQGKPEEPALLNVFGGKITTYRRLSEEVLNKLAPWHPKATPQWTKGAPLPGGEFPIDRFDDLVDSLKGEYPFMDPAVLYRMARNHGTLTRDILAGATELDDLGLHFGNGLYQREVAHLVRNEWARTAQDILWRRTKLGLRMTKDQVAVLDEWLKNNQAVNADMTA